MVLILYRPSDRADAALRALCSAAREDGSQVTVLALASQERPRRGCCDTRSALWNGICRDLANDDLAQAARAVRGPGVDFGVLVAHAGGAVDALAAEAVNRGADEIVLADPAASGLGRLERRRLRRRSPIPVRA